MNDLLWDSYLLFINLYFLFGIVISMSDVYSAPNNYTNTPGPPMEDDKAVKKEANKLDRLVNESSGVLLKVSTVFPFDLFPDELTIDANKVNIKYREFFFSEDLHSIMIPAIKDVEVQTSPLFGTLRIVPDGYPGRDVSVRYLKKEDAIKARRIIQGLMLAVNRGINTTVLDDRYVKHKVEDLGEAKHLE